jgi:hypothetical protein
MRRRIALLAFIFAGLLSVSAADAPQTVPRYELASVSDLLGGGCGCRSNEGVGLALFAVPLPETDLAVLLRPLTEREVASYLVQAIDWRAIESEILAAAVVWPSLSAGDVFGLAHEVEAHLRRAVNEISGFEVFGLATELEEAAPEGADR